MVDDLDNRKRKYFNEQEELELEQREREQRMKLNQTFKKYVQAIETVAGRHNFKIEFDIPYGDLGFEGTHGRALVKLFPTVNCLVSLTEFPFFVCTLDEIEVVHFERVSF